MPAVGRKRVVLLCLTRHAFMASRRYPSADPILGLLYRKRQASASRRPAPCGPAYQAIVQTSQPNLSQTSPNKHVYSNLSEP